MSEEKPPRLQQRNLYDVGETPIATCRFPGDSGRAHWTSLSRSLMNGNHDIVTSEALSELEDLRPSGDLFHDRTVNTTRPNLSAVSHPAFLLTRKPIPPSGCSPNHLTSRAPPKYPIQGFLLNAGR